MLNIGQLGDVAKNEHIRQKLAWQMSNLMMETRNAFANWSLAYASEYPESTKELSELLFMAAHKIQCISKMPKGKGPIVILGSGSSLNDIIPTLKYWKGAIMCSTSQASTMVYYGRTPEYIVCLDPRVPPQDELAAPDWGDAVMIAHVSIPFEYISRWIKRAKKPIYLG